MKKVKITVLKTTLNEDLAAEYGVKGLAGLRPVLFKLEATEIESTPGV